MKSRKHRSLRWAEQVADLLSYYIRLALPTITFASLDEDGDLRSGRTTVYLNSGFGRVDIVGRGFSSELHHLQSWTLIFPKGLECGPHDCDSVQPSAS